MSGDKERKPTILGLCNPLLDISAYVDEDLLDKYKLKPNNVILASDEHKDLCKELTEKYQVEYTAGGSAMNVMRVVAGIYRGQSIQGKVLFTGCVGSDEFGKMMNEKSTEDGVITNYAINESVPTGTCAVCLTDQGKNRSLCAFLGASQHFNEKHIQDNWQQLVENTDLIYISGFLIAVSPKTFHLLGEHIAKSGNSEKRFCLNLSAPYVSQVFGKEIDQVIKYVDILFGNDEEAKAYADYKNYSCDSISEIALEIAQEPKVRSNVGRIVVITQGEQPIIVARQTEGGKIELKNYPVDTIPNDEILDTNGAGDAFAGGFVSQFAIGEPIEACIEMGSWAARQIIKVSGVSLHNFTQVRAPSLSANNNSCSPSM